MRISKSQNQRCDVLLLYPSEKISIFEYMIPLGLASLAAVLEDNGYIVEIIDFANYAGNFVNDLSTLEPKVIGIGGTTATRKGAFYLSSICKGVFPRVPVVYGGVHATFTAEDTLHNIPSIDYIIKGEGEFSFLSLCNFLVRNDNVSLSDISGLAFKTGHRIISNKVNRIENIDQLPSPARHLFGRYSPLEIDFFGYDADFLMTSRGCPAGCSFCSASRMFPGGVRYRSITRIQNEVEAILAKRYVKALKIFDSTFTSNREHVITFCNMIKSYGLYWECEIRADDEVDRGILDYMHQAGCCYINMGIETTNPRLLKKIGKCISIEKAESILKWCREIGIKTKVFFTFGHPGQTYKQCLEDVEYMRKHRDQIDFFATTVGMRLYPGTPLERWAKNEGVLQENFSWAKFEPSIKNFLLLEFGDTLILRQNNLSYRDFFKIILKLTFQRTVLSKEFIWKHMVCKPIKIIKNIIASKIYKR